MKDYKRLTKKDQDWFEFTEITDNEIYKRLQELENKIENGTLIKLPCKVGDTVYYIDKNYTIQQAEVTCIDIRTTSRHIIATRYVLEKEDTIKIALMFEDFNVDYWLTKAEAEAKLKELKGEK